MANASIAQRFFMYVFQICKLGFFLDSSFLLSLGVVEASRL